MFAHSYHRHHHHVAVVVESTPLLAFGLIKSLPLKQIISRQ